MSRSIFEINQDILNCIDEETGEFNAEVYESLALEKSEKIDSLISWVKELKAEAGAIKAEEEALAERRKVKERKAEKVSEFLSEVLDGSKFESAKNKVSFRRSVSCNLIDEKALESYIMFTEHMGEFEDCLKSIDTIYKYNWDKQRIKDHVLAGAELPGVEVVIKNNIQIK